MNPKDIDLAVSLREELKNIAELARFFRPPSIDGAPYWSLRVVKRVAARFDLLMDAAKKEVEEEIAAL